jgi:hypothetical protein
MAPPLALPLSRSMPRKKKREGIKRPSWYHRKRPPTIARALIQRKMFDLGTGSKCIADIKKTQGILVNLTTFMAWIDGWSAPSGVIRLAPCGRYLQKSVRCRISAWAGIEHESWWWTMIDKDCLKPAEIPSDPFKALGLRPPDEA